MLLWTAVRTAAKLVRLDDVPSVEVTMRVLLLLPAVVVSGPFAVPDGEAEELTTVLSFLLSEVLVALVVDVQAEASDEVESIVVVVRAEASEEVEPIVVVPQAEASDEVESIVVVFVSVALTTAAIAATAAMLLIPRILKAKARY